MTTNTVKKLSQTELSATLTTTLYTVPASTKTIIKEIVLVNSTAAAMTATIRAGATPATNTATLLLSAVTILPGETRIFRLSKVLDTAGDLITGGASAGTGLACSISGVEIV